MDFIQVIGFAAAGLTSVAFLPQAVKTIKSRSTRDISLGMYATFFSGLVCWLVYGLLISNLVIIVANIFTLIPAACILYLKLQEKS